VRFNVGQAVGGTSRGYVTSTIFADGALDRIVETTDVSDALRVANDEASWAGSDVQAAPCVQHDSAVAVYPMSLPPTVKVTREVSEVTAPICGGFVPCGVVRTFDVVAPEHETSTRESLSLAATRFG
jgi:hypothetical protein